MSKFIDFLIRGKKKVRKPKIVIYFEGKLYRHSLTDFKITSLAEPPPIYHDDYVEFAANGKIIFDGRAIITWMSGRHYPEIPHCFIEPLEELGL